MENERIVKYPSNQISNRRIKSSEIIECFIFTDGGSELGNVLIFGIWWCTDIGAAIGCDGKLTPDNGNETTKLVAGAEWRDWSKQMSTHNSLYYLLADATGKYFYIKVKFHTFVQFDKVRWCIACYSLNRIWFSTFLLWHKKICNFVKLFANNAQRKINQFNSDSLFCFR